jgi:catechol 2,3-dioxygenase-like lactoylglutathione lyase family enzyme
MKYISTLIAVSDMKKSKQFYHDVLGMKVVADFGANVTLDGGLVMQTMDTWKSFIRTDIVLLPNNAGELYFEEEDLDAFLENLKQFDICYVHPLFEHRWGQRVVRFYDPDRHIIEVGEKIDAVILRFVEQGLSPVETAVRMDIPVNYVIACLNKE